jgi:hypothetical protein
VRNTKNSRISQTQKINFKTKTRMASLATQETKIDLGNNDIVIDIDYTDIDTYASKKAASFGTKGNFQGEDDKGEKIEPSGTGKNEGKFTLKDVRKCPNVQKWINRTKADGEKEVKVVSKFSSKTAEELFSKKFPDLKVENWQGKRTGKRTKGSITCKDIKDFLKTSEAPAVVTDDKKFTTKKMFQRIDSLGTVLKAAAKQYLNTDEGKGDYKGNKLWGKKEVDAAIKHAMESI